MSSTRWPTPMSFACRRSRASIPSWMTEKEQIRSPFWRTASRTTNPYLEPRWIGLTARCGNGRQFGNLILSRLPIIQVFSHLLPQPAPAAPCKHMPRQALEVIVEVEDGPLRITTTHLEYHCARQRLAQAARLRELQLEITANQSYAAIAPSSGPYAAIARPARSIICGDFNSAPDDAVYQTLTSSINGTANNFYDAWRIIHGETMHAPTTGIYDQQQWPEGPHCRDFFFVSGELSDVVNDTWVQEKTDASDHQPVLISLDT